MFWPERSLTTNNHCTDQWPSFAYNSVSNGPARFRTDARPVSLKRRGPCLHDPTSRKGRGASSRRCYLCLGNASKHGCQRPGHDQDQRSALRGQGKTESGLLFPSVIEKVQKAWLSIPVHVLTRFQLSITLHRDQTYLHNFTVRLYCCCCYCCCNQGTSI